MFYGLRRRIGPHKEILRALWQNRDSLPRAWRILNEGVCDGCALGTRGLKDWTIDGYARFVSEIELASGVTVAKLSLLSKKLSDISDRLASE